MFNVFHRINNPWRSSIYYYVIFGTIYLLICIHLTLSLWSLYRKVSSAIAHSQFSHVTSFNCFSLKKPIVCYRVSHPNIPSSESKFQEAKKTFKMKEGKIMINESMQANNINKLVIANSGLFSCHWYWWVFILSSLYLWYFGLSSGTFK